MELINAKLLGILRRRKANQITHTVLPFLESVNGKHIDTGIRGQGGLKVEMKVMFTNLYTSYFFGARGGTSSNSFDLLVATNALRSDYYNSVSALSPVLATNTEYVIKKMNNKQYINDVEFGSYTAATFDTGYNLFIFGVNGNPARADYIPMKLHYLKIWDVGNTLIRDFVPVNKDGINCLFDNVSKAYFYYV